MSSVLVEQRLTFTFESGVKAVHFEKWAHHAHHDGVTGNRENKRVDMLAITAGTAPATLWLLEAKDFRIITNPPSSRNIHGLADEVNTKVRHSLSKLAHAADHATNTDEREFAGRSTAAITRRAVLHLEPYAGDVPAHTQLFPVEFAADVLMRLKTLLHDIAPRPLVLNIAKTQQAGVPWRVS